MCDLVFPEGQKALADATVVGMIFLSRQLLAGDRLIAALEGRRGDAPAREQAFSHRFGSAYLLLRLSALECLTSFAGGVTYYAVC